jgi:iron complex outermembrane recepter protein
VHHLTAGFYYSNYYYKQTEELNAILTNVKNRPDALDIQALNAAGQVVGDVTENGFISYGSGGQSGALHGHSTAFYGADTWNITPKWSVDAGVRHVNRTQSGYQGVLGTVTADATGPVAARTIYGVVSRTNRTEHQHGTSWTIGSGYIFTPRFNIFARYTNTFSFPRFDTLLGNATLPGSTEALPVAKVKQGEAGVKYKLPGFQITATGFWSKFNRLNGSTQVADANGTLTTSNIVFNSRTYGVELEAIVSPFRGFDITATGMLQNPKIISIQTLTGTDAQSSSGGEIPRTPKYQLSVQPAYSFRVSDLAVRLYGDVFTIGRRFQDDSNFSRLPAYTSIDLGASITTKSGFQVRAAVNNVANVVGLTEGNSRSAAITSASSVADSTIGRSIFGRNFTLSISKRW